MLANNMRIVLKRNCYFFINISLPFTELFALRFFFLFLVGGKINECPMIGKNFRRKKGQKLEKEKKKFPFSGNSLSESVEIVYAILLPER